MIAGLLEHLLAEIRRVPGLTVGRLVMLDIDWNPAVDPPLAQWMAEETGRDLEWDKFGNPVFMPKDEAQKQAIRDGWKRYEETLA